MAVLQGSGRLGQEGKSVPVAQSAGESMLGQVFMALPSSDLFVDGGGEYINKTNTDRISVAAINTCNNQRVFCLKLKLFIAKQSQSKHVVQIVI